MNIYTETETNNIKPPFSTNYFPQIRMNEPKEETVTPAGFNHTWQLSADDAQLL